MLQVNSISYSYSQQPLLNAVSFELTRGDSLGIAGLNGSGKSTLLRILAGQVTPQTGSVRLNAHPISDSVQHNKVGFVGETANFIGHLSVFENLCFAAKLRGLAKARYKACQQINQMMLEGQQNTLANRLSSGYQQRLSIALALIHEPELLILDEASNWLDDDQKSKYFQLLSRVQSITRCIIVMTSHHTMELEKVCSRLGTLNDATWVEREKCSNTYLAKFAHAIDENALRDFDQIINCRALAPHTVELQFKDSNEQLINSTLQEMTALSQKLIEFRHQANGTQDKLYSAISAQ